MRIVGFEHPSASPALITPGPWRSHPMLSGLRPPCGDSGAKAIETIISKVHNSPGEDIAVLLLGYEDEMMKMLREVNPGLMRRFSPESAFHFEDFTDAQLKIFTAVV